MARLFDLDAVLLNTNVRLTTDGSGLVLGFTPSGEDVDCVAKISYSVCHEARNAAVGSVITSSQSNVNEVADGAEDPPHQNDTAARALGEAAVQRKKAFDDQFFVASAAAAGLERTASEALERRLSSSSLLLASAGHASPITGNGDVDS